MTTNQDDSTAVSLRPDRFVFVGESPGNRIPSQQVGESSMHVLEVPSQISNVKR